jgi:hypothetical protein
VEAHSTLFNYSLGGVQETSFIGASPNTVLAAKAAVLINQHYAVLINVCRLSRANINTGRIRALHTGSGKVIHANVRVDSRGTLLIHPAIIFTGRNVMFILAGYGAPFAAHAFIQVDNESISLAHCGASFKLR